MLRNEKLHSVPDPASGVSVVVGILKSRRNKHSTINIFEPHFSEEVFPYFILLLLLGCAKKETKNSANNHESNSTRPPPKIHFEKVLSVSCFGGERKTLAPSLVN